MVTSPPPSTVESIVTPMEERKQVDLEMERGGGDRRAGMWAGLPVSTPEGPPDS